MAGYISQFHWENGGVPFTNHGACEVVPKTKGLEIFECIFGKLGAWFETP